MIVISVLLIIAHLAVLFCAACIFPEPGDNETALSVTFGVTHGEIALLALWTVYGRPLLGQRLVIAGAGVGLVSAVFCVYVLRTNGPPEVCVISALGFYLQWVLTQIPFWLTKKSGWIIARGTSGRAGMLPQQFHIRHLFIWTTAIAVAFAAGNALAGRLGQMSDDVFQWIAFFAIVTIANILMAGPTMWATLSQQVSLVWMGAAVAAIGMLTSLEATVFRQLPVSADLLDEGVRFIVVISIFHAFTIVTALLVVRGYGYRLIGADLAGGDVSGGSDL